MRHDPRARLNAAQLDALITASPFNAWLGQSVLEVGDEHIEVQVRWREEFIGGPQTRHLHGGIFAALINSCGCYAVAAQIGRTVPIVDLRCDFHRPGKPGDLRVLARVIKLGRMLANVDVTIHDLDGQHLASGRAIYLSQ